MFDEPESIRQPQNVTVGDDLYGLSVGELEMRIDILRAEVIRTQAALTKKQGELSDAETLFAPKGG